LPANLDLTSTVRNIPVLPGGMFTIGAGGPVNGVAGKVVSDTFVIDSKFNGNGRITSSTPQPMGRINIFVTGSNVDITENGQLITPLIVGVDGKRGLVTPAEALALYLNSRTQDTSGQGTLTLDTKGNATSGIVTLNQSDVNGTNFTAFKIPAGVTLDFSGSRVALNLPTALSIAGTLQFITPNSIDYINLNAAALKLNPGAQILADATSQLILSGTGSTWTNNGTILAGQIVIARPKAGPLTFITGANATTGAPAGAVNPQILLAPSVDVGMTFTFKANGAASDSLPIVFGNVNVPALYGVNALANAVNAANLRTVSLTFSMSQNVGGTTIAPITPVVGGTISANTITIKGIANTTNLQTVQTPVTIAAGADFTAVTKITISTAALLKFEDGITLTAGQLKAGAPDWNNPALLLSTQIAKNGSITLTSTGTAGIDIGSAEQMVNNGSKLTILAELGNITMGNGGLYRDMGGNIYVLAKGTVRGGAGNDFQAKGITGTATGGVEIGSGLTAGVLATAFSKPANTEPPPTAISPSGNVLFDNNRGVIYLNNPKNLGTFDLTTGGTNQAVFHLSHGAVVFDATADGSSVQFDGIIVETQSAKPVAHFDAAEASDIVVDTEEDLDGPDHEYRPCARVEY
jgi:hypothetical protein